jgi:hypothetical protein
MSEELCRTIENLGRANRGTYGRRNSWGGEYFSDLRQPKMPSTLLEIEFHDWYDGARCVVTPGTPMYEYAQSIVEYEENE